MNNGKTRKVKAKEAAKHYNTSVSNLRKWAREGSIPTETTPKGHYTYIIPVVSTPIISTPIIQSSTSDIPFPKEIIYARVSSRKQSDDLKRQSRYLSTFYPNYHLIADIGSGINFKRKGFKTILEQLIKGNIKKVVVAYKDRFTRFGFDYFQWMFQQYGAVLESLDQEDLDSREDLLSDLMEVITVFTARYHGRRKYKTGKAEEDSDKEDKVLSDSESEVILQ
jgi:predicted site-specific integrase-resolvase